MVLEIEQEALSPSKINMFLAKENKGFSSQEIHVDASIDRKIGSLGFTKGQKTTINIQRKENIVYLWKTSSRDVPPNFNKNVF